MADEGIIFKTSINVGKDITAKVTPHIHYVCFSYFFSMLINMFLNTIGTIAFFKVCEC